MRAYDESLLPGVRHSLGSMLETAVWGYRFELTEFFELFLKSPLASKLAAGEYPCAAAGTTEPDRIASTEPSASPATAGVELVQKVLASNKISAALGRHWHAPQQKTPEYWVGSSLAYYQWAVGRSYSAIQKRVSIDDVRALYGIFGTLDAQQFCGCMDELVMQAQERSCLQEMRLAAGLSQSQLAQLAEVPVRTLQQYEQRQKNINHARADYVLALARTLRCEPLDLLEWEPTV